MAKIFAKYGFYGPPRMITKFADWQLWKASPVVFTNPNCVPDSQLPSQVLLFVIPAASSGSLWLGLHSAGVEPRTFNYLSEIFIPARDLQYFSRFHIGIGFVKRTKMMKSHWIQLGVGFCAAIHSVNLRFVGNKLAHSGQVFLPIKKTRSTGQKKVKVRNLCL